MGVAIWKRLCIDRIHMTVGVSGKLYGFVCTQLKGMYDIQSDLLPEGKMKIYSGYYKTRLDYYPDKKRKIADIEIGTTKSKHKYFRLSLFPSQFHQGEFEHFKEILALLLPEFNYAQLYNTARVSYIELAADSCTHAAHSFIPFRARCNASSIYEEPDGTKGTTYLGSKLSKLRFSMYDKHKQLTKKKLHTPHKTHTRIEARMRHIGLTPSELLTQLKNPFLKLEIADLDKARSASDDKAWQSFIDECLTIGSAKALKQLAKPQRKTYVAMLRNNPASWWKPDYIWSKLPHSIAAIAP